ncbi:helix-turn-helix transcriptional regulator [Lysinibacillus sp. KU-BSD001]|uniref:helix-turn-helix domain-containing protein n=1 Tax=Lysinibacillus sp. KU-BSD001 TaxID=3141328 RepID=UPI0036E0B55D
MYSMQEAIRQRIAPLMQERNLTISELARRAGLTQSTVNDIVKGKVKNPSMQAILQIADALGLSIGEFTSHPLFENITRVPMKLNR